MKWWIEPLTSILNTMKALSYLFDSAPGGSVPRATAIPLVQCFVVALFSLCLLACGNKGPLYLPIDETALQELEIVQEELDDAEERNAKKNSTTTDPDE